MSNRKLTSEKVLKAMTLNQKEDRVLAKTFGTLDLERKFATNVLDLHLRTVRSNYRHLKEKVSKVRSNLSPEEILALRKLEVEGKMKPINSFNLNAAMKIAAAARRLNLYPEGIKRAKSAAYSKNEGNKLLHNRAKTEDNILKRKRSNSVTGVFIDAPVPENTERRNSIEGNITLRPISAHIPENDEGRQLLKSSQRSRPSTTNGTQKSPAPKVHVSLQQNSQRPVAQNAPFSSHEAVEKEAHGQFTNRSQQDPTKTSFTTSEDNFENNLGADLFEERRIELLQEENLFYSNLQKRKNDFMFRINEYLEANPPVKFDTPIVSFPLLPNVEDDDDEDEEEVIVGRHMRKVRQYDFNRTFTSEEAYKERGEQLWKDMNKTRYLRIPDDKIDLSGVVTLAKEQMKLFKVLKSTEPAHVVTH